MACRRTLIISITVWMSLLGCVRVVTPPQQLESSSNSKAAGERCMKESECASGVCTSGVCCEHACAVVESCVLPGSAGFCTRRELGDACDVNQPAQCPSQHCVDGVCCDAACEGTCRSCVNRGQEGHCALTSDNEDHRDQCGSGCSACFGGYCLPAQPGTNPHQACGENLACDALGACSAARGAACDANPCAVGNCLAGSCLVHQEGLVASAALDAAPLERVVLATALDANGRGVVLVRDLVFLGGPGRNDRILRDVVLRENNQGGWDGVTLPGDLRCSSSQVAYMAAALVTVGTQILVVTEVDPEICEGQTGAVVAHWIAPNLTFGRREVLDLGPVEAASVHSLATHFDSGGVTVAAVFFLDASATVLRLAHHALQGGTWSYQLNAAADVQATTALAHAAGSTYAVFGGAPNGVSVGEVVVLQLEGVNTLEVARVQVPSNCEPARLLAHPVGTTAGWIAIAGEGSGGAFGNAVLWAEFHPERPEGQRLGPVECVTAPGGGLVNVAFPAPVVLGPNAGVVFVDVFAGLFFLTWRDTAGGWSQLQLGNAFGDATTSSVVTGGNAGASIYGLQLFDNTLLAPRQPRIGTIRP